MPDVGPIGAVQDVYEDEQSLLFTEWTVGDRATEQQLHQPLLTADEIAAWLAVPRSSVYEYARRAHEPLPAVRIGRHVRFVREDVAEWIGAQRDLAAAPGHPVRAVPPSTPTGWRGQRPR